MISVVKDLEPTLGYAPTCYALGLARATFYRHKHLIARPKVPRQKPKQALSTSERSQVL